MTLRRRAPGRHARVLLTALLAAAPQAARADTLGAHTVVLDGENKIVPWLTPLAITRGLIDYSLAHGITPADYAWPNFPQTAADAGATEFRGFTGRFDQDDVHVDLAGDMRVAFFRMYLYTGDATYLTASTGAEVSDYCSNWFGCVTLFDLYPTKNGLWVDGHSDTKISGTGNLSHTCASNATLYLLEHPDFDPDWQADVAALLAWAEQHFVFNCSEEAIQWGAYTVAEQEAFRWKMGYQTARYAAACAQWYKVTGDPEYRERAYRALNWTTYFTEPDGRAQDGPSDSVGHWWSDCYGEYTRMFYPAFAAVPGFAPPGEDHLLYSYSVLKT